jgi:hypothetical protein
MEVCVAKGSSGLFMNIGDYKNRVVVLGFRKKSDGSLGPAEASGKIRMGDLLVGINGQCLTKLGFKQIIQLLSMKDCPFLYLRYTPASSEKGQDGATGTATPRSQLALTRYSQEHDPVVTSLLSAEATRIVALAEGGACASERGMVMTADARALGHIVDGEKALTRERLQALEEECEEELASINEKRRGGGQCGGGSAERY